MYSISLLNIQLTHIKDDYPAHPWSDVITLADTALSACVEGEHNDFLEVTLDWLENEVEPSGKRAVEYIRSGF